MGAPPGRGAPCAPAAGRYPDGAPPGRGGAPGLEYPPEGRCPCPGVEPGRAVVAGLPAAAGLVTIGERCDGGTPGL